MIIAVDIDDVLLELVPEWVRLYNLIYNDDLDYKKIKSWNITDYVSKCTPEQFFDILDQESLYNCIKPSNNFSLEYITKWRKDGHRVIFVTATSGIHNRGRKLQWLFDHGFVDNIHSKDYFECLDKCLLNFDVIIDDRPETVYQADKLGKLALLYHCYHNSNEIDKYRIYDFKDADIFISNYYKKHSIHNRDNDDLWKPNIIFTKQDNYDLKKGGVKFDDGKPRFDLLPPIPIMELAKLFTEGAKKYDDRNWESGMRWGRQFSAMMRHAFLWWSGEEYDPETKIHHLISVAWNAICLREQTITHPEFDDRQKYKKEYIEFIKKICGGINE